MDQQRIGGGCSLVLLLAFAPALPLCYCCLNAQQELCFDPNNMLVDKKICKSKRLLLLLLLVWLKDSILVVGHQITFFLLLENSRCRCSWLSSNNNFVSCKLCVLLPSSQHSHCMRLLNCLFTLELPTSLHITKLHKRVSSQRHQNRY